MLSETTGAAVRDEDRELSSAEVDMCDSGDDVGGEICDGGEVDHAEVGDGVARAVIAVGKGVALCCGCEVADEGKPDGGMA